MSLYLLKYHKALSGFVIQPIIDASLLFNKINENICSYFVTSVFGLHFEANDAEKKSANRLKRIMVNSLCVCFQSLCTDMNFSLRIFFIFKYRTIIFIYIYIYIISV